MSYVPPANTSSNQHNINLKYQYLFDINIINIWYQFEIFFFSANTSSNLLQRQQQELELSRLMGYSGSGKHSAASQQAAAMMVYQQQHQQQVRVFFFAAVPSNRIKVDLFSKIRNYFQPKKKKSFLEIKMFSAKEKIFCEFSRR